MARPGIALVFFQAIKSADVLRIAHPFEDAHVFSTGKDVGAVDACVDAVDAARDVFAFVQMAVRELPRQGRKKVTEDERLIRDRRDLARLDLGRVDDLKVAEDERLRLRLRRLAVVKQVKCIKILIMRINSVSGKPAAQPVGTVVHDGDRIDHALSAHDGAAAVDNARHGATGRISELSFLQHTMLLIRLKLCVRVPSL